MRFQLGELAKFVVARNSRGLEFVGQQCIVTELGPIVEGTVTNGRPNGGDGDYVVRFATGPDAIVRDFQLQKLNPPEEPVEMTHHEEVEA